MLTEKVNNLPDSLYTIFCDLGSEDSLDKQGSFGEQANVTGDEIKSIRLFPFLEFDQYTLFL